MFSYGVRLLPRLGFEGHHLCASDVRIASGGAGEHDDLALPARSRDGGTHALEALRIRSSPGVVDHDGHTAVVQADDGGTGEPAQYSELLSCPRAELFEIEGCAIQRNDMPLAGLRQVPPQTSDRTRCAQAGRCAP